MKYCDNLDCEFGDEPLERISDYHIMDGVVLCTYCYERQGVIVVASYQMEQDAQEELTANQQDYDFSIE